MSGAATTIRWLGALLLFGIGAIHLYEYFADHYRVIPVIGPLFVANFAVAVALGLALTAPLGRLRRPGHTLLAVLAIGFAASTIAGLAVSEASTLFGFHERGYRTTIDLSLAFEGAVILLFALYLALELRSASPRAGMATAPPPRTAIQH